MKRAIKNTICTLLFLILCSFTALFAYLYFFQPGERNLSGEWTAELDMSGRAAVTALDWLQDIEGVSISLEEMDSYMPDLTVRVNLGFQETARSEGTFHSGILPESYEACSQAAYEAFALAFRSLVAERLRMAGYTGGMDGESIEALVDETFGMSTVAYLTTCCPALLPSLEELQAQYDGSGTYTALEGVLTRQFEAGGPGAVRAERYIRKGPNLILSGEAEDASGTVSLDSAETHYPVIYTLSQAENR